MKRTLVCLLTLAALAGPSAVLAAALPGAKVLPGIYTTTLKGKKPASLNGDWALQIMKNGDYKIAKRVKNTAKLLVSGEAFLSVDNRITFRKETGPAACKGTQAIGVYRWSVVAKTLLLTRVHDTCVGRRTVLGGTLTKVQ